MLNTRQIPNVIFDYWMCRLTDSQFKVLMTIASREVEILDIQQTTGFVEKTVRAALNDLMHFRLITETILKTYHLNDLEEKEVLISHPCIKKKEITKRFHLKRDQKPIFEEMKALNLEMDDQEIIKKIRDAFKDGKVQQLKKEISDIRNKTLKN